MGLAAYFVLWAIYRFDFGVLSVGFLRIQLPAAFYWQQLWNTLWQIVRQSDEHLAFLLGQASLDGWWYYFAVAGVVKMPLPLIVLAGMGILVMSLAARGAPVQRSMDRPLAFSDQSGLLAFSRLASGISCQPFRS